MPRDTLSPDTITPPFFRHCNVKKDQRIKDLRARINALERPSCTREEGLFSLGIPEIDCQLPAGGFLPSALYEIIANRPIDAGAATGFCITLLAALLDYRKGRILWCLNNNASRDSISPTLLSSKLHAIQMSCGQWRKRCGVIPSPPFSARSKK